VGKIGSMTAYAKNRKERGLVGGTLRAVQKAIASGRITKGSDGRIDFDRADRDWEANLNHRKRRSPRSKKKQSVISNQTNSLGENEASLGNIPTESFLEAQRRHEWLKVQKEDLELRRRRGELVELSDIEIVWSNIVSASQDRFLGIPGKLAPRLVSISSVHECQILLEREIREALALLTEYKPNAA
jgi:hypothetical protein